MSSSRSFSTLLCLGIAAHLSTGCATTDSATNNTHQANPTDTSHNLPNTTGNNTGKHQEENAASRNPLAERKIPKTAGDIVVAPQHKPFVIHHATILTGLLEPNHRIENGYLVVIDGKIAQIGSGNLPAGLQKGTFVAADKTYTLDVIDAQGSFVTPGIIDTHSHMGVYPLPSVSAHEDGNEATAPTTPDVWAEHSFWPQDPSLERALAGGITTIQVLPGSANLVGGRSFTAKLKLGRSAREMRFAGAPQGLKMACGENPKRVYGGEKHQAPSTRMGNVAGYRTLFQNAVEYERTWQHYDRDIADWRQHPTGDAPDPPKRDLALETLVDVMHGKILVHNHCYRADEMSIMIDLSHEFGFQIRSFHHALEAYKIADLLARENVSISTWADWWGFKMEAFDGIPQNAALVSRAGARTIIHSDSEVEIRRLNQEAAKAVTAGRKIGVEISEAEAIRWITANPAWALGVEDRVGTLEIGKMADLVVWDKHPLSVYSKANAVYIDGEKTFDRSRIEQQPPRSDFELGILPHLPIAPVSKPDVR